MKNSVRRLSPDMEQSESVDRSEYYSVQTPQGFRKSLLIEAYEKAYDESFFGTDDAAIVENAGGHITIVDGEYQNIKITTKEDLPMENRVGTGYDVHRLAEGEELVLGGVKIPHSKGCGREHGGKTPADLPGPDGSGRGRAADLPGKGAALGPVSHRALLPQQRSFLMGQCRNRAFY